MPQLHEAAVAPGLGVDELLELDVDILVLAALENVITKDNASKLKAAAILEIANGPVNFEADETLEDKGIAVLPDVLVNSGGVIVSYLEWVQNRSGDYWPQDVVEKWLAERLDREAEACFQLAADKKVSFRTAAYIQGIGRIAEAMGQRGTASYFGEQDGRKSA